MRLRGILLVSLCLLALCTGAMCADKNAFFFVQLADTQIGFTKGNEDLSPEINNFRKAVAQVNRLKPAFVIISGDLVNTAHDPKQIRAFWQVARDIDHSIPLYLVSGNHDVAPCSADDERSYIRLFGRSYYSFDYQGSSFIVLDSSVIHYPEADSGIREAQRAWFEDALISAGKSKPNHIFVLTHHPWFVTSPDETDTYDNIPLTQRRGYLSTMDRVGADYALAGHFHKEASAKSSTLNVIVTCAVSKGLGKDPEGFRIVKVYKDRVEHEFYALDKAPEKVTL